MTIHKEIGGCRNARTTKGMDIYSLVIALAALLISAFGVWGRHTSPKNNESNDSGSSAVLETAEDVLQIRKLQANRVEVISPSGDTVLIRIGVKKLSGLLDESGREYSEVLPAIVLYDNQGKPRVQIQFWNDRGSPKPYIYVDSPNPGYDFPVFTRDDVASP